MGGTQHLKIIFNIKISAQRSCPTYSEKSAHLFSKTGDFKYIFSISVLEWYQYYLEMTSVTKMKI